MVIRTATLADLESLVTMGRHQVAELYGGLMRENPAQLAALSARLITGADSVMFLAERDSHPTGMIGMVLFDHHITGERTAGEVAWWIEPGERGGGLALLRAGERWAAEHGAAMLQMMAPNERVGRLYERRGYTMLETTYAKAVEPIKMTPIHVVDDVLPDSGEYRQELLNQEFDSVEVMPGVTFHGIGMADNRLPHWIAEHYPALTPNLTFVRKSPAGQVEPNFIHTDNDMGEWTGIYYLSADPPAGDGTTFWRDRQTGAMRSDTVNDADEQLAWRDDGRWEPWQTVEAKHNRLVLFPAGYFHSRALHNNYGDGDTARLIQVVFGTGQVE